RHREHRPTTACARSPRSPWATRRMPGRWRWAATDLISRPRGRGCGGRRQCRAASAVDLQALAQNLHPGLRGAVGGAARCALPADDRPEQHDPAGAVTNGTYLQNDADTAYDMNGMPSAP